MPVRPLPHGPLPAAALQPTSPPSGPSWRNRWISALLLSLALLTGSGVARAATHTVTSNADSGAGSLRQAIAGAAAGDVIQFDMAQVASPILLTSGSLVVDKDLTIAGPGGNQLAVSGGNAHRVFHITVGTVLIDGLTISNGAAGQSAIPANNGGGILVEPGVLLTVNHCTLTGNQSGEKGGGIYSDGIVTVSFCTLQNNTAGAEGGGIYNGTGTVMISDCQLASNLAGLAGAALYNGDGLLAVTRCTLHLNNAGASGGGIHNENGTTTVSSSTLSSNVSGAKGGGIRNANGISTLSNCTLSGNIAGDKGGGAFNGPGSLTLSSSTLSDNLAGIEGGGTFSDGGSSSVTNALIAGNEAAANGETAGTAFTSSVASLIGIPAGMTILDILLPLADNGGPTRTHALAAGSPAIDAGDDSSAANLTFDQRGTGFPRKVGAKVDVGAVESGPCAPLIVVTNTNDSGPGSLRLALVNVCPGGQVVIDESLAGQTIVLSGGELVVDRSVTLSGPWVDLVSISGNNASRVFHVTAGTVVIDSLTIRNGLADNSTIPGNAGAGIFIERDATLTVQNSVLTHNTSGEVGAAIYNDGTVTVAFSTLHSNTAGSEGGGIFNNADRTTTVSHCILNGNIAGLNGAGICNHGGWLTVSGSTLHDNNAGVGGGGIYNDNGSATIVNCTLSRNIAGSEGAGLANEWGWMSLSNSTLTGNISGIEGAGIFIDTALMLVANTLVAGNIAPANPDTAGGVFLSSTANLIGVPAGMTILDILLPLADNGGFTPTHALAPHSPAIDVGDDASAAGLDFDQRGSGFARKFGSAVDIGAFEVQNAAPSITCFDPTTVECTPAAGHTVTLTVKVSDPNAQLLTVTLFEGADSLDSTSIPGPALGAEIDFTITLAPGVHSLNAQVSDGLANPVSCGPVAITIVADTTAPTITCPGNVTVNAVSPSGATVTYSNATASDACSAVSLAYSQASGTVFGIGQTTVTVTATDGNGNSSSCSFQVTVKGAVDQIGDLIAKVNALPGVKSPNKKALITKLRAALSALAANNPAGACVALQDFLNLVKAQADKKLISAAQAAALTADATRIRAVIGCP